MPYHKQMQIKTDVRKISRRGFLLGASTLTVSALTACAGQLGSSESYLTNVVKPTNLSPVFEWTDVALQALRDQLVAPPLATRALTLGPVAGLLAVNGIEKRYEDDYNLGPAPIGADPAIAYGVAAWTAFAEHFQQPMLFDQLSFLKKYPNSEAKIASVKKTKLTT